ncbi:MAG: STAS domain-containing protein [Gallionellaceae bacterium]|nr:STAS domain-containing protein [Gallionellaceae bacterium]
MISRDGDRLQVSGSLTIETVTGLLGAVMQPGGNAGLVIDLGKVEAVDSAGVSLLLSWLRRAQQNKVALCFSNVPDNLLSLARLYGVAELLPLSHDASTQP